MPPTAPAPTLLFIGGFLGSGKTSLMGRVAERLALAGRRVGLVTNDQAAELVDTASLRRSGLTVDEVAGGCFCCRFDVLLSALERLREAALPEFLVCEPVGSCTDISATVLQPLKRFYPGAYQISPYTVLADPARLLRLTGGDPEKSFPGEIFYIFRTQMDEADALALTKTDLHPPGVLDALEARLRETYPEKPLFRLSSETGEGLAGWLDWTLAGHGGGRLAEVDYDVYAKGEAMLGWLNATVAVDWPAPVESAAVVRAWVEAFQHELGECGAELAHLKIIFQSEGGSVRGNVTHREEVVRLARYPAAFSDTRSGGTFTVNCRACVSPETLEAVFERATQAVRKGYSGEWTTRTREVFSPARPEPTHRFASIATGGDEG
jgi:G3E family GTPase